MIGINTISLDTVKVEEKEYTLTYGKDKGQKAKLWNVSIMNGDTWYGGAVFKESHAEAMKKEEGKELELFLYQEEYNGKMYDKWIFPNDKKRPMLELKQRIELLEEEVFHKSNDVEIADSQENREGEEQLDDLPF